jgi:hypothetical protein
MGLALAAALCISFAVPAIAGRVTNSLAFTDTLAVGTSAETIYSNLINISGYDYVGFNIFCDVVAGGNAGAAALSVEGRGRGQTAGWTSLYMIDFADSLNIVSSFALSSTVDIYKHFIITAVPLELKNEAANRDNVSQGIRFHIGNIIPFEIIRVKVVDTNWNAAAKFYGNVILGN